MEKSIAEFIGRPVPKTIEGLQGYSRGLNRIYSTP
jgi:hypothetical protein